MGGGRTCLLLINWFKAKGELSSGVVEGFSMKAKLTIKKHYGFRTFGGLEITLNHAIGYLPEPEMTHRFFEKPYFSLYMIALL